MRRIPWLRAATLGMCASIALAVPATAAPHPNPGPDSATTGHRTASPSDEPVRPSKGVTREEIRKAQETERYWTPERIRGAVPLDAPQAGDEASGNSGDSGEQRAPGERRKRSLQEPTHPTDAGIATVGVFLIRGADGAATPNQFCSASAVTSPTKSLVITAAHCLKGDRRNRDIAFVPGYRAGASKAGQAGETPYGIFPMKPGKVWIDKRYLQASPNDDVDFAFLRVGPNSQGQLLEDATGRGNQLTAVPTAKLARKDVTVVGYPGGQKTPLQCTNDTSAFQGRFMEIKCAGFRAGVSGGPFLENFDGGRGNLVGVIGGYKTGGLYDHTSYTSQFDDDVFRLYEQAVSDATPDAPNTMGSAETWKNARAMTTGRFHTASVRNNTGDLIVRWSDGEVSLYPGDGEYGFRKDIQLTKANPTWKRAAAITAGNFTGDDTYDLLVRWSDGALTLYKDVNETNKLRNAVKLQGPNGTWTHASVMAAGRFGGGNTRSDDLVVRWSDGEVTLYTNVDGKGLHAEKQLTKPNTTWPYARDITAGDFDTTTGDQDLFVRWGDGEVSVYANIAAKGLKAEHQLCPAKSPWRAASLSTAGVFGGNSRQDDIVTLWPASGKLSMNTGTTVKSLARERILVP
ncbi:trypsin-like peptidase domain-containing protein [Streptomyces sp. NPDC050636]|uniref:trypsin-like serine peptidase n=1 Tax=Streptomyces sp. NPDC050636 TaxID=3154510 RepID=UPI00342D6C61